MTEEELEYIIKETEEAIRLFKEYYEFPAGKPTILMVG